MPSDLEARDWGVTYDQLEPHYTRAERLMGVSGKAGNLRGKIVPGGNPFEGARSEEFPTPALERSYLCHEFTRGAEKLGYHPFPMPGATLSQTYRNPDGIVRAGCAYCGFCDRFGCMIGAKAQPTNTLLPVLAKKPAVEIRPGCWVRKIVHENGRATGIEYVSDGKEYFQPASLVVLSSWTLNNTRLLYLSNIGTPYDPTTRKGTLGRNLTHQVQVQFRVFLDKPLNGFMGTGSLGVVCSDVDGSRAFDLDQKVLRGGSIYSVSIGYRPINSFGSFPPEETTATWGADWKRASIKWNDRAGRFIFGGEHLPWRGNFMDLDPTYKDKVGDPLLRLTLDWTDHERAQSALITRLGADVARAMGAKYGPPPVLNRYDVTQYRSTHIQGGAAMGSSPETSVVNPYLQHWDMQNLFVLGASAFPNNPSGNPTLTALALTYRASDALIDKYLKHEGSLA